MILNPLEQSICEQLQRTRIEKGLSQRDCAVELGISEAEYRNLENGKLRVYAAQLFHLSKFMGASMASFFEPKE